MTISDIDRRQNALAGLMVAAVAFVIYWISDRNYDAGRGDLFYLADAFLHGRTWIDVALGPLDLIRLDDHIYVPFGPFPAIALSPLVALIGAVNADHLEPGIDAGLGAMVVGLAWWAAGRIGVQRWRDRLILVILLGFSTQIWWVTTRGGVWHTGHLVATILTLLLIGELFGRRRVLVMGLLIGADFLTRAPVAFVTPIVALWLVPDWSSIVGPGHALRDRIGAMPWSAWGRLAIGLVPALAFFLWYNAIRFGSPFESGYGLATLPEFLQELRAEGLFSLSHVPMNLDYLFLHLPTLRPSFPYFVPDGLGMSVFITSPGLLLAFRAPPHDRRTWFLTGAAVLVLIPTLLYYGGGWFQYGYRYFLDSIPFVWALVALGIVHRGPIPWWGRAVVWFGVLVGAGGVYWAYHIG